MKKQKNFVYFVILVILYLITFFKHLFLLSGCCLGFLLVMNLKQKEEKFEQITQGLVLVMCTTLYPSMTYLLMVWMIVQVVHQLFHHVEDTRLSFVFDGLLVLIHLMMPSVLVVNLLVIGMSGILVLPIIQFYLKPKRFVVIIGCVIAVIYLSIGALLPFVHQPEVSEATKQSFHAHEFLQESQEKEKAKIISDNGLALKERIRLITQAKEEIILSTFEFDADISGQQMLAALLDASNRGVKVSILVDGFPYLKAMAQNPYFLALSRQKNVEIKQYNPISIIRPWTFMGRMHDKYLIVDDIGYIMGGRNTYDFFLGDQEGYKNYDWDIYVLGDQSLKEIKEYFYSVWNLKECHLIGEQFWWKMNAAVNKAEDSLIKTYNHMRYDQFDWFEWQEKDFVEVDKVSLIFNPTHIYAKEPIVFYQMSELMQQASHEVMIHTPYMICNDYMLERLSLIPNSSIMTNSVVNNGNPFGAMDYQVNKSKIIATGTQLLEYEQGISYHGKCFTIDDYISGIGSFNWDMRSAYLDTEIMAIVAGKELNKQCRDAMKVYEDEALVVLDEENYLLQEGQKKKEGTMAQKILLKVLEIFGSWARFLM